jgi:hypothetical protein
MRKYFGFVVGLAVLVGASLTASAETFTAYLNGAQQVPVAATTATGFGRVFVDEGAGTLTFTVTFNGLGSAQTLSHIHAPAAIGANASVIIDFGAVGGTSGTISGTRSITPTQLAQLRAGQGYINVHSVNFPNGEIRGQLARPRPIDYDGDGRMDFTALRFPNVAPPGLAQITYFNLLSSGGSSNVVFGNANSDFPAPGDYDGDGKGDICLFRTDINQTPGADTFFLILRSSDNTFASAAFGVTGDRSVARDYNGDGKTDMAVFRAGAAVGAQAFFFYRNTANQVVGFPFGTTGDTAGGTSGDVPVPADYDGDGKTDLAVYRFGFGASTDNTYIYQRSTDGVIVYQKWGNFQSDWIIPGDFDGDGKSDFMAGRTGATGTSPMFWWLLRSSDGGITVTRWGISSDFPTQGDYDGDGRVDIALVRQAAATGSVYHIIRSLDNSIVAQPWGQQADFPAGRFDTR